MDNIILTKSLKDTLENDLRSRITGFIKVCSVSKHIEDLWFLPMKKDTYQVSYIDSKKCQDSSVIFSPNSVNMDIRPFLRESIIDSLLTKESIINSLNEELLTDSQSKRVNMLRLLKDDLTTDTYYEKIRLTKEYASDFSVGQKIWFKGNAGIITFEHLSRKPKKDWNYKTRQHEDIAPMKKFSVKVNNFEYRNVDGNRLTNRIPEKFEVEIDPKLDKLSTEKLLKMYKYKRKHNYGRGDINIKAILNQREHIQKGETIVKYEG